LVFVCVLGRNGTLHIHYIEIREVKIKTRKAFVPAGYKNSEKLFFIAWLFVPIRANRDDIFCHIVTIEIGKFSQNYFTFIKITLILHMKLWFEK
jgi:hypothetical protein